MKDKKLIIAIMSCSKNRHTRQQDVINIWADDVPSNVEWLFFEGGEETKYLPKENRLIVECPDIYEDLALKTHKLCQYVSQNIDFDFMFKCDDDTLVLMDNLLNYPIPSEDYIGNCNTDKISGIKYGVGGGYLLSKKSVDIIANYDFQNGEDKSWWYGGQKTNRGWRVGKEMRSKASIEDLMVATILNEQGIQCFHWDDMLSRTETHRQKRIAFRRIRRLGKKAISYHPLNEDDMIEFYDIEV
jgi:hypothetical protein